MKALLLLFVFIISIQSSFSYEVQGLLENTSNNVSILEGESFNARINIWPMADEDLEEVKLKLNGQMFLDYFYIVKVNDIKFSENNTDVIVAHAKVVLTKAYEGKSVFIWTYKSLTIPFDIKKITPVKNTFEQDFIILNQKDGSSEGYDYFLVYGMTLIFIIISIFITLRFKRKRDEINKRNEILSNWKRMFLDVKDRSGVEEVYRSRKEWLVIVGGETPPIKNFFEELDRIQYKEDWTDIEEHKILEAYDELRGIFERS